MRTTLTLDDDIFEAARSLSRASGESLGRVLSQLARRGLTVRRDFAERNDLPVFSVAPNAPVIPSGRARQLEDDDEPR